MQMTHEFLLERIREKPLEHLGGYSPFLIGAYFMGYDFARRFHRHPEIPALLSQYQFLEWFRTKAYAGPQGYAAFCILLTNTEEKALELFFEFRKIALRDKIDEDSQRRQDSLSGDADPRTALPLTEMILSEPFRNRPAMYLGNHDWISQIWTTCNGYVWAERDFGVAKSRDALTFERFQEWTEKRYPFSEGRPWGKLFDFLGMGSSERALEEFYDVFELFLEGESPDAQTGRCREWIAGCVAEVEELQKKGKL
jgi:hypothetical protein